MHSRTCSAVVPLALIALLLTGSLSVSAQDTDVAAKPSTTSSVPSLIRYSGTLKDADGKALSSQTAGVIFSIYKESEGGVAVWSETRNVVTSAGGQYTILLGSTKSEGLPASLFSDQEQRWLGVQVEGQSEQPRVMLVSVPYAFKAHEAETLGGLPASAFLKAAPMESAGGSPVGGASAVANAGVSTPRANTLNPTSTINNGPCPSPSQPFSLYVPLFVFPATSANIICDSVIRQNNNGALANVGVGKAPLNAGPKLDVSGDVNVGNSAAYPVYKIGYQTVLSSGVPLSNNLFVGISAGANPANGGVSNTFVGVQAGATNTSGFQNTFAGFEAGFANTAGFYNTFVGVESGSANINGFRNTFSGAFAGQQAVANDVTLAGFSSGRTNTADGSTFYGAFSGSVNTSGVSNTFVGNRSGLANTAGAGNTFLGDSAGMANVGSNNTFTGQNAGGATLRMGIASTALAPARRTSTEARTLLSATWPVQRTPQVVPTPL